MEKGYKKEIKNPAKLVYDGTWTHESRACTCRLDIFSQLYHWAKLHLHETKPSFSI